MGKDSPHPQVGIGVTIMKDGLTLLGRRKGSHAAGEFASPGGALELGEKIADCVVRETREETGLEVTNIRFVCVMNLLSYQPRHYLHVQMAADWQSGEPQLLEPDKCEGWEWHPLDDLPQPLFATTERCLESMRTGQTFWEAV